MKVRPFGSTAEVIERSYNEMGGIKQVQYILKDSIGVEKSQTQLYAYRDPDEHDQISFDLVRKLVRETRCKAVAEDMASLAGGFFVPGEVEETCIHRLTAKTAKEYGEALAAAIEAMQDPAKRQPARKEIRELMHVLACMDTLLDTTPAASTIVPIRGAVA
jgi:hypothetical protein